MLDLLAELGHVRLALDEVWHEELVRDECEPSKSKGRVVVWVQILEQVSQIVKNLALHLGVEALAHGHCPQDVHQQAVVRLLVEDSLLTKVVVIKLLADELENLGHELHLIQL